MGYDPELQSELHQYLAPPKLRRSVLKLLELLSTSTNARFVGVEKFDALLLNEKSNGRRFTRLPFEVLLLNYLTPVESDPERIDFVTAATFF